MKRYFVAVFLFVSSSFGAGPYQYWLGTDQSSPCQQIKYLEIDARSSVPKIIVSFNWTYLTNGSATFYIYDNPTPTSHENTKMVYASLLAADINNSNVCLLVNSAEQNIQNRGFGAIRFEN